MVVGGALERSLVQGAVVESGILGGVGQGRLLDLLDKFWLLHFAVFTWCQEIVVIGEVDEDSSSPSGRGRLGIIYSRLAIPNVSRVILGVGEILAR